MISVEDIKYIQVFPNEDYVTIVLWDINGREDGETMRVIDVVEDGFLTDEDVLVEADTSAVEYVTRLFSCLGDYL